MHLQFGVLLCLWLPINGITWQLGVRQPNRPEADVCGIARDYLLPSHTAYQNLEQLATVDSDGKVSSQFVFLVKLDRIADASDTLLQVVVETANVSTLMGDPLKMTVKTDKHMTTLIGLSARRVLIEQGFTNPPTDFRQLPKNQRIAPTLLNEGRAVVLRYAGIDRFNMTNAMLSQLAADCVAAGFDYVEWRQVQEVVPVTVATTNAPGGTTTVPPTSTTIQIRSRGIIYASSARDSCLTKADVVFLLDGSGSVSTANFALMKAFVNDVIDGFDIGLSQTRIAAAVFAVR
jgi:hypothetical protein